MLRVSVSVPAVVAKKLAVEPIERILAVVDIVNHSLNSFKRHGNLYDKSVDGTSSADPNDDDDDDGGADFETSFLEEAVLKMADLLHMVSVDHSSRPLFELATPPDEYICCVYPRCTRGMVRLARRSSSPTSG